jgi:hypothetical protein
VRVFYWKNARVAFNWDCPRSRGRFLFDENHKLAVLLDTVTTLVAEYERGQVVIPKGSPSEVLRFLMAQNNLKQIDLVAEIGSQSVVSSILSKTIDCSFICDERAQLLL